MISAMMKLPCKVRHLVAHHPNINWTFFDQAVVSGANFLTAIIITRFLGLEAFGVFSLAWLIVLFAQSLQQALILSPMLSIGPKQLLKDTPDYYGSLLILQAGFALLSSGLAGCLALFAGAWIGLGEAGATLAFPMVLAVAMTQMHEFFRRACFARGAPATALRIDVLRYGGQITALLIVSLEASSSVEITLLIAATSAFLGSIGLISEFSKLVQRSDLITETFLRHWEMAKWLLPSALMQWTSGHFFTLAAGVLLGPTAVGALRSAQNLMGFTRVGFEALSNWAPVRAAHIYKEHGTTGLHSFIRRLMLFTGGGTLFAVLALALPAQFWLHLIYGMEFAKYGWVVAGYGAVYLLMALGFPLRYGLTAREKTRPVFVAYLIATIFSLMGVYPLISLFGLAGAVAGTITSTAIVVGVYAWCSMVRKQGDVSHRKEP